MPDDIVMKGLSPSFMQDVVVGRTVTGAGRKGKYFWIEFDEKPWLFAHLGMAGWVREVGAATIRLREHGEAPLDDETGRPRFLKMMLTSEDGRKIAMTDGRRLSRIWVNDSPNHGAIAKLGPDCYLELPSAEAIHTKLAKKNAPIKAVLLDQAVFAGVGNWIADEVLYVARIRPSRLASSLSASECTKLHDALKFVVDYAVEHGADKDSFPDTWLFHSRWGGKKGDETIGGEKIIREQIGGRTTAWVPTLQK